MGSKEEAKKAAQGALSEVGVGGAPKQCLRSLLLEQVLLWAQPLVDYIKILEEETESSQVRELQGLLQARKEEIRQLRFDWDRMYSSGRTSFHRCPQCKGLHDSALVCPCGYDE